MTLLAGRRQVQTEDRRHAESEHEQQRPQPAAERRGVTVRPTVRGRPAHTEDALRTVGFGRQEFLVVEEGSFVVGPLDPAAFLAGFGLGRRHVEGDTGREADERILLVQNRLDPQQGESSLREEDERDHRNQCEGGVFCERHAIVFGRNKRSTKGRTPIDRLLIGPQSMR